MHRNLVRLATALAVVVFGTMPAVADEAADARLRGMEERLMALEDKLSASEEVVGAQRDLLKAQATPAVSQGGGLDAFFSSLEVGGHITTSYLAAGRAAVSRCASSIATTTSSAWTRPSSS